MRSLADISNSENKPVILTTNAKRAIAAVFNEDLMALQGIKLNGAAITPEFSKALDLEIKEIQAQLDYYLGKPLAVNAGMMPMNNCSPCDQPIHDQAPQWVKDAAAKAQMSNIARGPHA